MLILKNCTRRIRKSDPYEKWQKLLLKDQNGVAERFGLWLQLKNVGEHLSQFLLISQVYFEFIYAFEREEPIVLRDGPRKYVVEFVADFLLTKTSLEPWEYALAPAALRLFYTFLYEKDYLPGPPYSMFDFLNSLDPHYVDLLKEQYS